MAATRTRRIPHVIRTLGGSVVVHARSLDELRERLRAGLPFASLSAVAAGFGFSGEDTAAILRIPARTLARRKRERRLSPGSRTGSSGWAASRASRKTSWATAARRRAGCGSRTGPWAARLPSRAWTRTSGRRRSRPSSCVWPMASSAERPLRVWRLCKRAHAAFDGDGARLAGGRWNRRGTRVVYASESLSLAALEILVHGGDPALLPADLVAIPADIPASVAIESLEDARLPADWRRIPAPESLAALGTAWAQAARTPVLSVPSAIVPQERNYLLNPAHPDFAKIRLGTPEPFSLDRRLRSARGPG